MTKTTNAKIDLRKNFSLFNAMPNFVTAEDLDNLLKPETRQSAILNIFECNSMDCMEWGTRVRDNNLEMSWDRPYLGESIKVNINLSEHNINPCPVSFVFLLQDEKHSGHLVVFSEPNPRVELQNPNDYLFAHDPDLVCIYSYGTSIKEFEVEVYRDVYKEQYLSVQEYLRAIIPKGHYHACAFLDTHPDMEQWLNIYQNQYMEGRTGIAFEFEARSTLIDFLRKVLALMEQYPRLEDQLTNYA
jgi:hypothetical protein